MNVSVIVKTLCTAAMLMVPVVSFAQTEGKSCAKQNHMWSELGLTEEQKVKLKELHMEIKAARGKNFENARNIRMKIRDELIKENPSAAQLDAYASELGEIHKEIAKQHNDHLLKVKTVLSAEQFSKIVNKETDGFGKFCMKKDKCRSHDAGCKKEGMENRKQCKNHDSSKKQPQIQ